MPEKYHRITKRNGSFNPAAVPEGAPATRLLTELAASLVPERLEWLWPPLLSLGNLSLLVGDPDSGKSLLALDIAARVTRGAEWPGGGAGLRGDVLLLAREDDHARTVRPRLEAAGADFGRVHILNGVESAKGQAAFSLARDHRALAAWLGEWPQARLLVLDPVAAALDRAPREAETRALLESYADLAQQARIAILGIVPLGKALRGRMLYRASAGLAFAAAARHVYAAGRDQAQPSRRLLVRVKNTLSAEQSGFGFTIAELPAGHPAIVWEEKPVAISAEAALQPPEDVVARAERTEAEHWLLERLANGPLTSQMLRNLAPYAKIGWRSIERAKARLGIEAIRLQDGWNWRLPQSAEAAEPGNLGAQAAGDTDPLCRV